MNKLQELEYLHTDNKQDILTSKEMRQALETHDSRKKVWEQIQEFIQQEENQELRQEIRKLAANEIQDIRNNSTLKNRLLSMKRKDNGSKWWKQWLTGDFENQSITVEDRACYGILCLYDQMRGPTPNTSGRWYFQDAQYRLSTIEFNDDTINTIDNEKETNESQKENITQTNETSQETDNKNTQTKETSQETDNTNTQTEEKIQETDNTNTQTEEKIQETLDLETKKEQLHTKFKVLSFSHWEYYFNYKKRINIWNDKQALPISIRNTGKKVMDIGIHTSWPNKGKVYVGLDNYIYQMQWNEQELDIKVLEKKEVFEYVLDQISKNTTMQDNKNVEKDSQNNKAIPTNTGQQEKDTAMQEPNTATAQKTITSNTNSEEENKKIYTYSPDILASGITLATITNVINNIKDSSLQTYIQENIQKGDVQKAAEAVGMSGNSLYANNKINAKNKIDNITLEALQRPNRVYRDYKKILETQEQLLNEFEQLGELPQDVKQAYLSFAYEDLATKYGEEFTDKVQKPDKIIPYNHKNYAIVSKSDAHVYLFDKEHHLVSRKACLLGKDRSNEAFDIKDYTSTKEIPARTPAGLYSMDISYDKENLGRYMQLTPQEGQITYRKFSKGPYKGLLVRSIGFHEVYKPEKVKRDQILKNSDINSKFISNGCINIDTKSYSELYDHISTESLIYITK
jgi:hypothetical protein